MFLLLLLSMKSLIACLLEKSAAHPLIVNELFFLIENVIISGNEKFNTVKVVATLDRI